MNELITKTELRYHKGDYGNFYLNVYDYDIDERNFLGISQITDIIRIGNKKIIWLLY